MTSQASLPLSTPSIDIARLVVFNENPFRSRWVVGASSKRSGQIGECLGTIGLRHGSGYEVVLLFDDGKIDTYAPLSLYPAGDR